MKMQAGKIILLISFASFLLGIFLMGCKPKTINKKAIEYVVRGIDVSHHNPILNWQEVNSQNIHFAYIKATEGVDHLDRNYPYNYERARAANVKIGSYHFYRFAESGVEQAKHFIKTAICQSGDLAPAIDIEFSALNHNSRDSAYLSLVIRELEVLENELYTHYGVHPIIYVNKECFNLYVKDRFPNNYIWMCDLNAEPSEDINWHIWQHSHAGKLSGMENENIDFNYYRYSFDRFHELLLP